MLSLRVLGIVDGTVFEEVDSSLLFMQDHVGDGEALLVLFVMLAGEVAFFEFVVFYHHA